MRTPAPEVWRRSPLRSPSRLRPDRSARPDGRSDLAAGLATITLPAAVRRWRSAARLAAGHTVTEAGCAIGLDPGTGKLVGFSWADAERGVLLAGIDFNGLVPVAAAVTGAALRRCKTVLVLDLAGRGEARAVLTSLAAELGVPVQEVVPEDGALAGADSALAAAVGRAIRTRSAILTAGTGSGAPLISDVADVLAQLRELGLHADCLLWVSACEAADPSQLADLLDLGAATGTVVLASTTSVAWAKAMAAHVGLTVECGRADEFTMTGSDGVRAGRMVPALALTFAQ